MQFHRATIKIVLKSKLLDLAREAIEDVDELGELLIAVLVSLDERVGDAAFDVEAEDGEADPVQRGLGGGELLEDLDAQARLLDHATDPAHLVFDAIEPRHDRLL